jgi:flagellar hook-associated protein 1
MTDILSIGASATMLYQKSLATVSNNVANLHSEGYSRQEAVSLENPPAEYGVHYVGTGAYLGSIKRNYDVFVERNLSSSLNQLSSHEAMLSYTSRLIDSISSESIALAPAIDRFFGVAEKLSIDPSSAPVRADLLAAGDFLAGRIRDFAGNLSSIENESARDMESKVNEVNSLSSQLADINRQLQKNSMLLKQPMSLLDQRDRVLKELSALIGIDVKELPNGQMEVNVKDGGPSAALVSGDRAKALSVRLMTDRPGAQMLVLDEYGDNRQLLNVPGGSLSGLTSFRSDVLSPLMSQIDLLAEGFVNSINEVNRNGLTLDNAEGGDVFSVERQFTVTDTNNFPMGGTRVSSTRLLDEEIRLGVAWLGGDVWQVTDLEDQSTQTVIAQLRGNTLELPSAGISIQFGESPQRGGAIVITSERSAAHGIRLAIDDGSQFAFGEKYYVGQSITNQKPLETSLLSVERTSPPNLSGVPSLDSFVGRNLPITLTTSQVMPALIVPEGASDFVVSFRPPLGSDAELQLLTADFNHLLGAPLSAATVDAMRLVAFDADSRYVSDNRTAASEGGFTYRGETFFYGHKAEGFSQSIAIPVATGSQNGTQLIAANAIKINGVTLTGALTLGDGEALSAQRVAEWFNNNVAAIPVSQRPSVQAVVISVPATDQLGNVVEDPVTDLPLMQEVVRYLGDQVQFSFGNSGKPRDLSVLGLSTGLYASGVAAEKLYVYATADIQVSTDLQVNMPVNGFDPPRNALNEPFRVSFSIRDEELHYDLYDESDLLIARRRFDNSTGALLPGMSLRFDRSPVAGDVFDVRVNQNAASDNRNLLALINLRDEKLVNEQTLQDYYLSMVNTVGNVQSIASMNKETTQIIYEHAVSQKSQVSGVNLDQEAADLIRFQQAYQASAQIIQASIKLFDTLLNTSR